MDATMTNQDILAMIRQEIAANNAAQAAARSFSQGTTNFGLPQWEPNDKPTFLVDMNGAYRTIDTQMQANKNDANSAITAAESANTLSNQALTASRENAQNIVTLTNSLTNTQNDVSSLGSILANQIALFRDTSPSVTGVPEGATLTSAEITCGYCKNFCIVKIDFIITSSTIHNALTITLSSPALSKCATFNTPIVQHQIGGNAVRTGKFLPGAFTVYSEAAQEGSSWRYRYNFISIVPAIAS